LLLTVLLSKILTDYAVISSLISVRFLFKNKLCFMKENRL
jgi:hypothetical protein